MSVSRVKHENKVILDFSDCRISKNSITQSLRDVEVLGTYHDDKTLDTIIDNEIKIGMYSIVLLLNSSTLNFNVRHLRQCGPLTIRLYENSTGREINLNKDYRFKTQNWAKKNFEGQIKIKDLIEAIIYCNRLDKMKSFL